MESSGHKRMDRAGMSAGARPVVMGRPLVRKALAARRADFVSLGPPSGRSESRHRAQGRKVTASL